jgi:hypothetical protein
MIKHGRVGVHKCSYYRSGTLGLVLSLGILLCPALAVAQSVAFINPRKSTEIYWVTACGLYQSTRRGTQSMQAAAKSLGMAFEVQYAEREPLKTLDIARALVALPRWQAARIRCDHR